jgi:hypothetical protein
VAKMALVRLVRARVAAVATVTTRSVTAMLEGR